MHFAKSTMAALIAWGLLSGSPVEADVGFVQESMWDLPATPSEDRWLEVHQVEGTGANTLIHNGSYQVSARERQSRKYHSRRNKVILVLEFDLHLGGFRSQMDGKDPRVRSPGARRIRPMANTDLMCIGLVFGRD
jgi:hypothetical protein